jgi:UDP-N-acetylglucosamine--N-acetylmuramyl-(pentapeptide) pyrophosphoryl-undecaprenol N-acetylglucosamine transferase
VTPNIALIPALIREGWEIHYIGTEGGIERSLIEPINGVTYHSISSGKLRRYFDPSNFTDPFRVAIGACQSAKLVRRIKPNIVFSKGGFVSVPAVYGAKINGVPVLIHESDMTPGLANKLSAPFAEALCCTFPEAVALAGRKGRLTGTPLREDIFKGDRKKALKHFGFDECSPILMVMGGSSGAQAINAAVRQALPRLTDGFQILHLCGKGNLDDEFEGVARYKQVEYLYEDMKHAYAAASALVSRAGSNSLSEILALKKPALLIPYPKGDTSRGDQIDNARSFAGRGLARTLDQAQMTVETLADSVVDMYKNRGALIDAMEREPSADGVGNVMELIRQYAR